MFAIFLVQTVYVCFKNRSKRKHALKIRIKHKLFHIRDFQYLFLFEFIKWVIIDILRGKDRFKLFGIWAFTGYYGQGKTIGAVTFALRLKKRYKDIKIYTNFNMRGQDGKITCPEDIVKLEFVEGRKIIIFDEIQSTFSSTSWADFPLELLWGLTQCRKNQMCVFASTPVYTRMSIQLRESTDKVIVCKNVFNLDRWFRYKFYRAEDYEEYRENKLKLLQNCLMTIAFVASDKHYKRYNTKEIVQRFELEDQKGSKGVSSKKLADLKNELIKRFEERFTKIEKSIKTA
ncbi:MAG: zonular occludens toxin domain-containing protein [Clostridia bacterium]|nr:zonular occludens toxin domain-containing protein [Clostridia bacterium]